MDGTWWRERPLEAAPLERLLAAAFPGGVDEGTAAAFREGGAGTERFEALLELSRRVLSPPPGRAEEPVASASDVFLRYRWRLASLPSERFLALLLDVRNRPFREVEVSRGILDGALVHPREVFSEAVRLRAASVLLLHNHPSGDPSPSRGDREATRKLKAAGELLGIPLLDHVVVGRRSWHSFRESGEG